MYQVILLPQPEREFRSLDGVIRKRVSEKIDWLAEYADAIIHHPLTSLPDDLRGLCRIRVGDYRIMYWVYHDRKTVKVYGIEHRSREYRSLRLAKYRTGYR